MSGADKGFSYKLREFGLYLISKEFWWNILFIFLFFLFLFLLIRWGLKWYTNHGQQIPMVDIVDMHIEQAEEVAERSTFEIIITDSTHIVEEPGGIILTQVPEPDERVKENRKIYVTVTKYNPDVISVSILPTMYGKEFERKAEELTGAYRIKSVVVGEEYDPGPPGHILAVIYHGDTIINDRYRKNNVEIEKGSTLHYIVSKDEGGIVSVPDLVCKTYDEAKFILENYKLFPHVESDNTVETLGDAYVYDQYPKEGSEIVMDEDVTVYLTRFKPPECGAMEIDTLGF